VSKRRLSEQQRRRIAGSRRRRTEGAGEAGADESGSLGPERPATVLAQYGRSVDLLADDGEQLRSQLRANLETPVAGDRVIFRSGDDGAVVVAAQPRRTALMRPDKFGKLRCMAANIDQVVVVIAPVPEPHGNLIDRYLVASEHLGADAVLFLNKTDLLGDAAQRAALESLLAPYPGLGYPVLRGSASEGAPAALRERLSGRTSILAGQSGVGKSTLLNALLPDAAQRVGELSEDRGKGRHTTTTSRLFPLAGGGALIDSPGIREFGLWHLSREDVENGYPELRALAGHCRFRDCRHEEEPGCALAEAVSDGRVHPARLESFRHIINSLPDAQDSARWERP
jgi:ribosome biogenesis GTPase